MDTKPPEPNPGWRAVRNGLKVLAILLAFLIYAYAIDKTDINLEEPQDSQRQETVVRVIRALARPDIFEYDETRRSMNITIRMPCPEEPKGSQTTLDERTAVLIPNCADTTQDLLLLQGTGFRPRTNAIIRWHPHQSTTTRQLASFRTDADGNFSVEFRMVDIRPTEEPQRIEIQERWRTGIIGFSQTTKITWDKIVETIFLALMATTIGTILAVPLSFIAARNLMTNVGLPLASIMTGIIAAPIFAFIGFKISSEVLSLSAAASEQTIVGLGAALGAAVVAYGLFRFGGPIFSDRRRPTNVNIVAMVRLIAIILLLFFSLGAAAQLGLRLGDSIIEASDTVAFLGNLVYLLSESVHVLLPLIIGLIFALVGATFGSTYGQEAVLRLDYLPGRILTTVTAAIGLAIFVYGVGSGLVWLYQFDEPELYTRYPAIVAAVVGLVLGTIIDPRRPFPIGSIIYTLTRSILNITRSIEPLIYVIVFAVWVGIGPFAGVIALTIHTVAALGKLFSEQVENISQGPIEAVTATGANSLQTIVFAVVPQIVPPYIAFTLYRWDINVRFSTVIGFGGGGGIGFVLTQNINLLHYSQASVMMIAIALVVMSLDYVSSQIRARII